MIPSPQGRIASPLSSLILSRCCAHESRRCGYGKTWRRGVRRRWEDGWSLLASSNETSHATGSGGGCALQAAAGPDVILMAADRCPQWCSYHEATAPTRCSSSHRRNCSCSRTCSRSCSSAMTSASSSSGTGSGTGTGLGSGTDSGSGTGLGLGTGLGSGTGLG